MVASELWAGALVLLVGLLRLAETCSIMPEHPQTQYCKADFVIMATVRRVLMSDDIYDTNVYKVKIRRAFKMSEKAEVALKTGRIMTAINPGVCGVSMHINQTYLITGSVVNLQARVNMGNFVKPYNQVTPRQRKGFRMLYKHGCPCKITPCFHKNCMKQNFKNVCKWADPVRANNCHSSFGICLINRKGMCHWARAPKLNNCLQKTISP